MVDLARSLPTGYTAFLSCHTPKIIIAQINQAVTQMDEATQQNAALVEEASAAAESMKEQFSVLTKAVSVFKFTSHDEKVVSTAKKPHHSDLTKLLNRRSTTRKSVNEGKVSIGETSCDPTQG